MKKWVLYGVFVSYFKQLIGKINLKQQLLTLLPCFEEFFTCHYGITINGHVLFVMLLIKLKFF